MHTPSTLLLVAVWHTTRFHVEVVEVQVKLSAKAGIRILYCLQESLSKTSNLVAALAR